MHWHILGAGAVGGLFAARLGLAGIDVSLLLRSPQRREQLKQQANRLSLQDGDRVEEVPVSAELIDDRGPISHLLVTTKAYDSAAAMESIASRLQPGAQILLLQNGYGHQQQIAQTFANWPLWAGITTSGVRRLAPFQLKVAGEGETRIGPLNQTAALCGALPDGWHRLKHRVIATDIERALWQKLAINAAINPLTALLDCPNGALLEAQYRPQLTALCLEIEAVASACGQPLFDNPLLDQVLKIAEDTAENRSSMLEDFSAGRRTEIDQITGFICAEADRHGLETPVNRELLNAVVYRQGRA